MLSKDSMKKLNAMIGFKKDKSFMMNKTEDITHTDSGHYGMLLNNIAYKMNI